MGVLLSIIQDLSVTICKYEGTLLDVVDIISKDMMRTMASKPFHYDFFDVQCGLRHV